MNKVMFFVIANMFICMAMIYGGLNPYLIGLWLWNLMYLFIGESANDSE